MAKFVFKLDVVLEQRRRLERDRQMALGKIETQRLAVQARVDEVRRRLDERRVDLRDRLSGGGVVEVGAVRLQSNAALFGLMELRRLAIEMAGVLKRVEVARAELLAATVARKAMETLRDKAQAEWKREQAQREAAELDDLTLMRHGRGSAAGLGRSTHDEEAAV